jgi:hypothetical protein
MPVIPLVLPPSLLIRINVSYFKYPDLQQLVIHCNCSGAVLSSHNLIVASNNQITLPIGRNTVVWSVADAAGS